MSDSPDIPLKRCTKCGEEHPATQEHFHVGRGRYGFQPRCKKCRSTRKTPLPEPVPDGYKRCSQCEQVLSVGNFSQDKRNLSGIRGACKTCLNKQANLYRHEHHEEIVKRQAQGYQKHKGKIRERHKQYCQKNKEVIRMMHVQYQQKHKEEISKYQAQYRHTERGNYIRRAAHQRRRAHKRTATGTFTSEQIQEQLKRQRYRCYYAACGYAKFEKHNGKYRYHIDHTFPLSRVSNTDIPANDMGYLVLACPSCNTQKRDKFPWEWPEGGRLL